MSTRRILIVEDQALARTYLCSCVEKCTNCEVAGTLSRADAALLRCEEGDIDLIQIECKTDRGKAVVRIHDDGEGIAPELLPHIFDRFFSTRKGGAGIGLSLAKEIVLLHKGTISASNDGGAVFEISLPLRKTI